MPPSKNEPKTAPAATGGGAEDLQVGAIEGGGASLEKVRDILFGNQMRDVERRFARFDERWQKDTNDLKDDVRKRIEALEAYARQEAESLGGRLTAERDGRTEADGNLSSELKEAARSLERRIAALDEQVAKNHRELRQQMLEQHQRLSEDIRQKVDHVLAELARSAQELRTDKADRSTIAALLTEMALRLTDEPEGALNG